MLLSSYSAATVTEMLTRNSFFNHQLMSLDYLIMDNLSEGGTRMPYNLCATFYFFGSFEKCKHRHFVEVRTVAHL